MIKDIYVNRIYGNVGLPELLALIPTNEIEILDLGCGDGSNSRILKSHGKIIHGVTISEAEGVVASQYMNQLHVADLSSWEWSYADNTFDSLIFCHVLEHLPDPESVLRRYSRLVKTTGHVYIALPNALFWKQRMRFLFGRCEYTDTGLMDKTHLRIFSYASAQNMIKRAGYDITNKMVVGSAPAPIVRRFATNICKMYDRIATRIFPGLFGYHMLFVAKKTE